MALGRGLPSGYHRDFQFLKAPLFRGIDRTTEMLGMMTSAVPRLLVDRVRGARALSGDILATDEVFRRMTEGTPFRTAYREVAAEVKKGAKMPSLTPQQIVAARKAVGGMGNLAVGEARKRLSAGRRWNGKMRRRWEGALADLAGGAR
jgi:argininosuccinate lyase